jgi:hypothetical protein
MDPSAPKKKPMAFARRVNLFRREIKDGVSSSGFELLLRAASKISEGQISAGGHYYGSTMITIDLDPARGLVRDAADVATATKLATLLEKETRLLDGVRQAALQEAHGIACRPLEELQTDIRVRSEGCKIFVDVDVEGQIAPLSARRTR